MFGYVIWCTYTVYGLAALPIFFIRGRKSVTEETNEVRGKIKETKTKINETVNSVEDEEEEVDRKKLLKFGDKQRVLKRKQRRLKAAQEGCRKFFFVFRPVAVITGSILLLLSLILVISLALTVVDRTLHHIKCDATCGYILQVPVLFNPLDQALILFSKFFPIDYILICLIVIYVYFATLYAITQIGIRFFCLELFSFKKDHTRPQGLMTASIILMLGILALNNSLVTLAPTYAMYGSQSFVNGTTVTPCSINAPVDSNCTMTQLGTIVNGVNINVGFFGIIFYGFTWIFTLAFFICVIVAGCRKKQSAVDEYSDDDEESE